MTYPKASEPTKVGDYPALVKSGGGYVWDEVLEYRVWVHPELGGDDLYDGDDYFYAFDSYEKASTFADDTIGAEPPLVLILQKEFIDEPSFGQYVLVKEMRLTEWSVDWLSRQRRNPDTIANFFENPNPDRIYLLRE